MSDEHDDSTAQREGPSSAVVEHLRTAILQAMKDPETTEVVELLCDSSGWTVEEFLKAPHKFKVLELFLLSTPQLPQLRLFPYLTVVKIIHVGLESMKSLSYLHYVEELWLNENNIHTIEGLQHMKRLKYLFLQGNCIHTMEDIPLLPRVEKLWLCGNQIYEIKNLHMLPKLKSFWIASNQISSLSHVFTSHVGDIEEINLSNNKIYSLEQIVCLSILKSLRRVWFSDVMYGDTPICHLSNYTTFSLRHLSQLEQLDGLHITAEEKSLALSVYNRKSIYYNMRRTILNRNLFFFLNWIHVEIEKKRDVSRQVLHKIDMELFDLQESSCTLAGGEGEKGEENKKGDKEREEYISKLHRARDTREVQLESLERQFLDAYQRTIVEADSLHERLLLELNSCGNIRLEEGREDDHWYINAKELLTNRFDVRLYEHLGIIGVKVNRVFRIICQGLRERFDDRIRELDVDLVDARNRRALVRLFSSIPAGIQEQRRFLHEVMINGFSNMYSQDDDGVPFTNSLYYADQERLMQAMSHHSDIYGVKLPNEALSGQLIVSRLFLGKCVSEIGGTRDNSNEKNDTNSNNENSEKKCNETLFMKSDPRRCSRCHYGNDVFSIYRSTSYDPSVKVWHMFDKALLLPEYVIDFTYMTKSYISINPSLYPNGCRSSSSNSNNHTSNGNSDQGEFSIHSVTEKIVRDGMVEHINDIKAVCYSLFSFLQWLRTNIFHMFVSEEIENLIKEINIYKSKKKMLSSILPSLSASSQQYMSGSLSHDIVENYRQHVCNSSSSSSSSSCNEDSALITCYLCNGHISSIPATFSTSLWLSLKYLFLHNNQLSSISWEALSVCTPLLEILDVSCNKLRRIKVTKTKNNAVIFPHLHTLYINGNKFFLLEDLYVLHNNISSLTTLCIHHNPWMRNRKIEIYCFSLFPLLQYLNGISISRHSYLLFYQKRTFLFNQRLLLYVISEERKRSMENTLGLFMGGNKTGTTTSTSSTTSTTTTSTLSGSDSNGASGYMTFMDPFKIRSYEQVFVELMDKTEEERSSLVPGKKEQSSASLSSSSFKSVRAFCFRFSLTRDISWISFLLQLRHLSLQSHAIEDLSPLAELRHLKTLNVSDNVIKTAKPLSGMKLLSLDISQNMLTGTEGIEELSELRFLCMGENNISNVSALQNCVCLEGLYFAKNRIADVRNLYPLHHLPNLVSMDAARNPCSGQYEEEQQEEEKDQEDEEKEEKEKQEKEKQQKQASLPKQRSPRQEQVQHQEYRNYIIYNLPKLKVLDGVPVGEADHQRAKDVFAGRINSELLVDRAGASSQWGTVQEMDLSHCGLREVAMMEPFAHLKILHLQHNSLVSIDGLKSLHTLVALNLSNNRLGQCPLGDTLQHLEHLRSLSLENNHIVDISVLKLTLPKLKFLNLKGNEITSVDQGLQGLTDLRELLLGNNKLRSLGPECFANNLQLTDISAEENYIRSTEGLQPLIRLVSISLGSNRLSDLRLLLNDLRNASLLANATFLGNAVARKTPYRSQTIAALPSLSVLDNKEVTDEERDKAEVVRAAELTTPHNVVLDPSFSLDAVGGVRMNGAAVPPRALSQQQQQTTRFPVPGNPRLQLPSYKNARAMPQIRDGVSKGIVPRLHSDP